MKRLIANRQPLDSVSARDDESGRPPGGGYLLAKCDYFVDIQLWPLTSQLDARGWLRNFHESEMLHAMSLLNAFVYYSKTLTDRLFIAAFQQLSIRVADPSQSYFAIQAAWQQFHREVIVTYVEGETPSVTDSGFAFARRARQLLGLDQVRQILPPDEVLTILRSGSRRPVLFVDDFVGSGNQFKSTWERRRTLQGGVHTSFAQLAPAASSNFYFCPLFCTTLGLQSIRRYCPEVTVLPLHVIDRDRDGALGPQSQLWPDSLRPTAESFVEQASLRAGIPLSGPKGWRGFAGLGLAMAFEHSVPDATLPLFYWDANGWIPLLRRR